MEFSGQYLTYEDYVSMGGTLDQMSFNLLEFKTRKQINYYTFDRLTKGIPESIVNDIKIAMFELMNINEKITRSENISSENIDGYSVSYGGSQESTEVIDSSIRTLLNGIEIDGVPITYCGGVNDYKQRYYPIS